MSTVTIALASPLFSETLAIALGDEYRTFIWPQKADIVISDQSVGATGKLSILLASRADREILEPYRKKYEAMLLWSETFDSLRMTIEVVRAGSHWYSHEIARLFVAEDQSDRALSERELEVARLASVGMSNQKISEHLGIKYFTVKNHMHSILEKLGARKRQQVKSRLVERGIQ